MIHAFRLKQFLCLFVTLLHIVVSTLVVVGPAHAQSSPDNEAPVLDLQVVETGTAGDSQVFSATVTDDTEILEVVLYYRTQGDETYSSVRMDPIPNTSIYTVTIDTQTDESAVIEYYMNASDVSGNRVVRGFAFDPLTRDLVAPSELALSGDTTAGPPEPVPARTGISTGKKILYIGLGILAVGAIAAAAGGGGSSGGGDTMPGGGPEIPVVITVDPIASF